jgi:hypothetical protein
VPAVERTVPLLEFEP